MSSLVLCQLEKHFVLHHPQPLPSGRRGKRRQKPHGGSQHHFLSLTMGTGKQSSAMLRHGRRGAKCGTRRMRKESHPSGCSQGGRRQQSPRGAAGWETSFKQDPNQGSVVLQAAAHTAHGSASAAGALGEHKPRWCGDRRGAGGRQEQHGQRSLPKAPRRRQHLPVPRSRNAGAEPGDASSARAQAAPEPGPARKDGRERGEGQTQTLLHSPAPHRAGGETPLQRQAGQGGGGGGSH